MEHAQPDAVQRALATARLSQPERKEFDREDLVALGLFTPMGAAQAEAQVNTCCVKCAMSFRSCRWILHMTCKLLRCKALCPSSIQLEVLSTASRGEERLAESCSCAHAFNADVYIADTVSRLLAIEVSLY